MERKITIEEQSEIKSRRYKALYGTVRKCT